MKEGETILLISGGEKHLLKVSKNNFNTKNGLIKFSELKKKKFGEKIKTHLGKEYKIVKPTVLDIIQKSVKRTAQVILPKDIALILAYTGIGPDSLVVDAGTGSGYTSIFLGNYLRSGKIVTYEKDKLFSEIFLQNLKKSGLKNIVLKRKDVTGGIVEKNVDLILLDLQESYKVIKHAYNSLKLGGWLMVYCPTVDSLLKNVRVIKKRFSEVKVVENIVREWQTEKTIRPKTIGLMHTGFLIFARRV